MAVYVQFNPFIDLTKNSNANPYHLASTESTVVRAGCPVPGQVHDDVILPQLTETFNLLLLLLLSFFFFFLAK